MGQGCNRVKDIAGLGTWHLQKIEYAPIICTNYEAWCSQQYSEYDWLTKILWQIHSSHRMLTIQWLQPSRSGWQAETKKMKEENQRLKDPEDP